MPEHLSEAVLHGLVAALAVQALLRVWGVEDPQFRLRLRGIAVALPTLYLPALELLAPFRHALWFEDNWALFVGRRFEGLSLLGLRLDLWWLLGLGGVGLALFLRDFVPSVRELFERQRLEHAPHAFPELAAPVEDMAKAMAVPSPQLALVDSDELLLHCKGARSPKLVVSRGAVAALDPKELRAALAHELGHLAGRDVQTGWLLLAARALMAFNPAVQVVARAILRDAERRADDVAAKVTGDRLAVASGLLKLFKAMHGRSFAGEPLWWPLMARAREENIEERCRRMLGRPAAGAPPFAGVRLAAAAVGLAALLFFVT